MMALGARAEVGAELSVKELVVVPGEWVVEELA